MPLVAVTSASALTSQDASAQEWLKDRRFSEGPGYRAGDLEIHPGLAGEIGYDSNWFLRTDRAGFVNSNPEAGGELRITPSVTLSTVTGPRTSDGAAGSSPAVAFHGSASATYREFIGSSDLTQQRNASAHADARLDALPGRPWAFAVYGNYDRTIQPTVLADPNISFNRDDLGAGAEVIAQPNSGTLDWRVGYQIHAALFESSNGAPFDNVTHEINTRGRWKFRPRTALVYDGTVRFLGYTQAERASFLLHDSTPVRTRIGLTGLLTPRVSVLGMVGWAASFYKPGSEPTVQQYDSVIGQAEIKFFPGANPSGGDISDASLMLSSISLGYVRDYQNSYIGDFYGSDRGYAKIAYFFAGRALISLEGGVGAIEYPRVFFNDNLGPGGTASSVPSFTDIRADGTLFAEYRVIDSVGINATFNYTQNISNTVLPEAPLAAGGPAGQYDMNWKRFQAFLGVRWFM